MRILAGFLLSDMHWLKWDIDVPDCLKKQIFPWIEEEAEKLHRYHRQPDTTHHYTACCFLDYLKALRTVILQDAAAMMILHPERVMHNVFQCHKVFKDPQFEAFKENMKATLGTAYDKNSITVEQVLPGVTSRLNNMCQKFGSIEHRMEKYQKETIKAIDLCRTKISQSFMAASLVMDDGADADG
mmetsp:Transcript_19290/g.29070  ORF Transcript_19290/g.29070 Transcript_19290/m.29070 type:complete len:185 (+) Transcript_19290:663-1217(+)